MDDKRLERLYDYTKWHLGIYLSVASALTAATGLLAEKSKTENMAIYVEKPILLLLAVAFMFSAGACGGIVASSCTECITYDELWNQKHGPFGLRIVKGRHWAALEHLFFWLSVACAVFAVLLSSPIRSWLRSSY
jgi:hypothetical protein